LLHVLHGIVGNGDDTPATLLVFEWKFSPGRHSRRFRAVEITVKFETYEKRSGDDEDVKAGTCRPGVSYVAPYGTEKGEITRFSVTKEGGGQAEATGGYPAFFSLVGRLSKNATRTVPRMDWSSISGEEAFVGIDSGEPDGVRWRMQENGTEESGLPCRVRTAVLLERRKGDDGRFQARVETGATTSWRQDMGETMMDMVGLGAQG